MKKSDCKCCSGGTHHEDTQKHGHGHTHEHGHSHTHEHSHSHGHSHDHGEEGVSWKWMAVSGIMLLAGIILQHTVSGWFANTWIAPVWYILAFLPVGLPVLKEGWEAVRHADFFNEFTLMIIACIGAFCIGEYPEGVAVMLFYCIGEALQDRAVDKATRDIKKMLDVRPERAYLVKDGKTEAVAPSSVNPGETIEVKAGGRVPLDGELLDNASTFDTSALTGESVPRNIESGGEVLAGMVAGGQAVRILVTRPYDKSALARILELVKDARSRKSPTENFIRRFARVYTPVVFALALLIVGIPAIVGAVSAWNYDFHEWLYRGLVFLVVSCPCALVISVPLGYFAGIGAASREGILFKGGNYLDAVTRLSTVAFDKTGTLSTGRFSVEKVESEHNEERMLSIIMAAEAGSTHPIGIAVTEYASGKEITPALLTSAREVPGRGISAKYGDEIVLIGNLRLLNDNKVDYPKELEDSVATLVVCACGGRYEGYVALADTPREDATVAIDRLLELGVSDLHILSGDKQEVVDAFALKLGLSDAHGGLLPEDKAKLLEEMKRRSSGGVAFVGDGFNDAPVLTVSDVGIAMGGLGSDAAVESADIVIQNDSPSKVATAVVIGRVTRKVVNENIVFAIAVKVIVLAAGAFGFISLWAAVFADVGVSLIAVLNSLRIMRKNFSH